MPGLGIYAGLFQKSASAQCQLLNAQLHDMLRDIPTTVGKQEDTSNKLVREYLAAVHQNALHCPRTDIATLDAHYAKELVAGGLYYKTYFSTDELSIDEGKSIQNMVLPRIQADCAALQNGLSWKQWFCRVMTQRPRF